MNMLAILWLTVWATVGEAFYDDYNWYSSDDGITDARVFDALKHIRGNFSQSLRKFADAYRATREGDDELTLAKVKLRLRMLRVFKLTGNSRDFDTGRGNVLPLAEGAKYCTMGTHTRVDCNYCTCVAGQLYMCTGTICPAPPGRPQFMSTCREGKKRQIDSCNYCYCRNGHEICTTKDCRHNHNEEHHLIRSGCKEGSRRKVHCNRCVCRHGIEYCSNKPCSNRKKKTLTGAAIHLERCTNGQRKTMHCKDCKCTHNRWRCSQKSNCNENNKSRKLLWPRCKEGVSRKIDACNTCYCVHGQEVCDDNECEEEQSLPFYRRLRHNEKQCEEGDFFKVDSCNYCICLNGTQTCTSRSCTEDDSENTSLLACQIGSVLHIDNCNYCSCPNGEYVCTNNPCTGLLAEDKSNDNLLRRKKECDRWDVKYIKCNRCECHANRWICTKKHCKNKGSVSHHGTKMDGDHYFYLEVCSQGQVRKLDECSTCFCRNGQWLCNIHECEQTIIKKDITKKTEIVNFLKNITNGFQSSIIEQFNRLIKGFVEDDDNKADESNASHIKKYSYNDKNHVPTTNNKDYTKNEEKNLETGLKDSKAGLDVDSLISLFEHKEHPLVAEDPPCEFGAEKIVDECHHCFCRRGFWFCESKPCRKTVNVAANCMKGQRIEVDCIRCTCLSPEKGWKCHEKKAKCLDDKNKQQIQTHTSYRTSTCVEGSRRPIDPCNYCICHNEAEYCTEKPCSSDTIYSSLVSSVPECLEGYPVPAQDPCNTCVCHNSDILCTTNPCVLRKSEKKKPCVGGQKTYLPDGCNYCICQSGQEFCTVRACLKEDPTIEQNGCNEGEVTDAEDRCNLCVCIRKKIVCTSKDCSETYLRDGLSKKLFSYFRSPQKKMTQNRKPKCDPSKKYLPDDFDPNCPNECICDKNELLCSKKRCVNNWNQIIPAPFKGPLGAIQKLNRISGHLKPERCVEFQPLPSDDPCNSCICLNERKVCTIISCTDDAEAYLASDDTPFKIHSKARGNKAIISKKKTTFCEPFTFFSPDSNRFCRNCFCLHNGLALCLLNLCKYNKDIPHQNSPEELTEICSPGERGYPTKCVSCICSDQGKWICTREELAICHERDCDERDEFHMGFYPYCAGCKCSVKEWFCSIQGESCAGNATCPLGTFVHNPIQHCSICICGGYEEGSHNMCFTEAKCVRQVVTHLT